MLADERLIVTVLATPHLEANEDCLFEQLEAFLHRWQRQTKPARFLLVVTRADPQFSAPAGKHVERRHLLRQQSGRAIRRGRRHGQQPHALGVRREEREHRIGFQDRLFRTTEIRALPNVIRHGDRVEPRGFRDSSHVFQRLPDRGRPARPGVIDDVQSEFHPDTSVRGHSVRPVNRMRRKCGEPVNRRRRCCEALRTGLVGRRRVAGFCVVVYAHGRLKIADTDGAQDGPAHRTPPFARPRPGFAPARIGLQDSTVAIERHRGRSDHHCYTIKRGKVDGVQRKNAGQG